MQAYDDFARLARTALAGFKLNIGTFYGCRDTATVTSVARFYVSANGQGLPANGFTVGRTTAAEAVDALVRMLKAHRREEARLRDERDRAKRASLTQAA